jgi:MauM/NapG family ferredoxin protein
LLKKYRAVQLLRIVAQTFFFLWFVYLLLVTHRSEGDTIGAVERFFHFDPLLGLTTFLASRAFFAAFFFSIITVVITLLFGRYVCGWACPLGSLHHFFSYLFGKGKQIDPDFEKSSHLVWKYRILIFVLAGSILTLDLAGFLDPLSFLYRSFTTAVLPAGFLAAGAAGAWLNQLGLSSLGNGGSQLIQNLTVNTLFRQGLFIGSIFLGIVLLNLVRDRFWCRYLCPTGALLGLLARWNLVKLKIDADKCTECNLCNRLCQSQANPFPNEKWNPSECLYCYTCASECPTQAISLPLRPAPAQGQPVNLSRRELVFTSTLGLITVPLFDLSASERASEQLIRPPGALPEPQFLAKCIKCGECLKVCPTNGLQHAFNEAGILGIWTPILVPRIGYCEYLCSLCTQICPTGAIEELTIKEKTQAKIGSAWIRKHRCIPYTLGESCRICEERCPTSPKAIQMIETEVMAPDGEILVQNVPVVDNYICIGCGICETKCPVVDEPAIYCTNFGESRSQEEILTFAPAP